MFTQCVYVIKNLLLFPSLQSIVRAAPAYAINGSWVGDEYCEQTENNTNE